MAEGRWGVLSGWKTAFRLQDRRLSADEGHVRTPRGLLATLGVTLSMVAAAACVLFFTSTLVAVNGWPGLSAPPKSGPVALAPVERALSSGGGRSSPDEPVVLGAPAAPSAPTAPVGLAPTPGQTPGGTGSGSTERISSESRQGTTQVQTQETPTTPQITPIPTTPSTGSEVSIVPAVQTPATAPAITPAVDTPATT